MSESRMQFQWPSFANYALNNSDGVPRNPLLSVVAIVNPAYLLQWGCTSMEKSSALILLGGQPIWNGISITVSTFFNDPIRFISAHKKHRYWFIFKRGGGGGGGVASDRMIKIPFKIGSPPNENGSELFSMIVRCVAKYYNINEWTVTWLG